MAESDHAPLGGAAPDASGVERSRTVAVRLTPAEHTRWAAAAGESGRKQMGRWVRETITDSLNGRPERVHIDGLGEMRANLSRVGSNLNQIARGLNVAARGGDPGPSVADIEASLVDVRRMLAEVRDAIHEADR